MKCPVCKEFTFELKQIDENLQMLECYACGGHWLQSYQYWNWKESYNGFADPANAVDYRNVRISDSAVAKCCPECGKILRKYLVGKGTDITIERCETCRGIWFDKHEYDLLRSINLHDELHLIFSTQWQKSVEKEKIDENRERMLRNEIGDEGLAIVEQFRKWLENHEKRQAIKAYINLRT